MATSEINSWHFFNAYQQNPEYIRMAIKQDSVKNQQFNNHLSVCLFFFYVAIINWYIYYIWHIIVFQKSQSEVQHLGISTTLRPPVWPGGPAR